MVWPEDEKWFMLSTPEDETSGRWTTFSNPSGPKGVPSLTAWIGGEDAVAAEKQSDDQISSDVMENLRKMFPDVTDPDNVVISRWGEDENVLGAYSFPRTGTDFYADIQKLGQRMGKIYFAGEATSRDGWATVSSSFGLYAFSPPCSLPNDTTPFHICCLIYH